jgi:hypothetical protein
MRDTPFIRKNERTTGRHAARTRRRRRPFVEGLEDRAILTTFFTPTVVEQVHDGGGDLLGTVAWGMPLYTIYWGSYWALPDGQALQSQIQNSPNPMLYFSHYLDGLQQYGVPHHAGVPGSGTVEVNNFSDPANGFSQSNLTDVINNAIDNQGLPDTDDFSNEGLYLVFTPPGVTSDVVENGLPVGGYHSADTNFSFPFDFDTRHFAWIGDTISGSLDKITKVVSHEVAEAMTDPNVDAISVNSGGGDEIGDGDAEHFTAFLNGYEVQALWSQQDGAQAVYDGNSQSVRVTNANLVVTGDQFGSNFADTITVDLNAEDGVVVTENGETFSFPFGEIQTVSIFAGGGANTINVLKTSSSSPLSIIGGGSDTVNIGCNGSLQFITGSVTITNPPLFTAINVDASADSVVHIATLNSFTDTDGSRFGRITSLAPAAINYKYADTGSLNIRTGPGGINVNVLATGVPTSLVGNGPTTVNVGDRFGLDLLGPLTITNPPSFTTLNVNDSADQTGRAATLDTFTDSGGSTFGRITGLTPASISYKLADTSSPVTIDGGSGTDNFIVVSLPFQAIALNTGAGDDTVIMRATLGSLVVDGQGGNNTLIGPDQAEGWSITGANAGGVGGINFTNVQNPTGGSGADTFTFGDGTGVTGVINGGGGTNTLDYSFYRTGVTVNLPTRTATGTGVVLNIRNVTGSPANDSITGDFASNILSGDGGTDVLNGGSGADTFILAATQGTATRVTGFGTADTLRGANIANIWTITGANAGNVNGIAFTGIARLTGGTSTDAFRFTTGSVSGAVDGGGGTDALDYSADGGGAVTVNLATHTATRTGFFANIENLIGSTSAADTLLGPNAASTWSITGANAGSVGAFRFSAVENLTGGSVNDVFKFASAGRVSGRVSGALGTNTLDYSLDGGSAATVNLATSTASRTGGFAGIQALVGSSSAADKLIGPNATNLWSITATNAGKVGTFNFSAVENLTGGSDVDEFAFSDGKGISGALNGGAGNNWLDFAPYTTHVTVNLATGTTTGVSGGIGNIRDVRGGGGGNTLTGNALGNILIGGAGVDTITGGGRSILIGDKGNDAVKGGSADDIVIGGFTDFDTSSDAHDQALMAILTEWQSSDSYFIRISKIKAGVGVGSSKFVFGTTVHDDSNASTLTAGPGTDWFFKGTHDTITDLASGEQVN